MKNIKKRFMFRFVDELASEYKNSRSNFSELQMEEALTSRGSSNVRKWCQIGHCNNNKTSNILTRIKNMFAECTQEKLYSCKNCEK